jgi:hypothetical protein
MSDKLISKPFSSETYHNKQAQLISGSGLEDSASEAWLVRLKAVAARLAAVVAREIRKTLHFPMDTEYWPLTPNP